MSTNGSTVSSATRDGLRTKLLSASNTKPRSEVLTLFGQQVEVRQPSLGAILDFQQYEDRKEQAARAIIKYVFVPGTDERIFEEGDIPTIMNWPFTGEVLALSQTLDKLVGINPEDLEASKEVLGKDPLPEGSSV